VHTGESRYLAGTYFEDKLWDDLMRVTDGRTNEKLARLAIEQSEEEKRRMK